MPRRAMTDLPSDLINQVQAYTHMPWWNGEAYAEFKGYPQMLRRQALAIEAAVSDLHDVMQWLRDEKDYAKADRLRNIAGRLARAVPERPDEARNKALVLVAARGWR